MAGIGIKRPRIVIQPKYEEYLRWEALAEKWKRTVPQMVKLTMDIAVRYYREADREKKAAFFRETLDRFGLRNRERERLREAIDAARDALDKLSEVLR
jgi:hypothetical protein